MVLSGCNVFAKCTLLCINLMYSVVGLTIEGLGICILTSQTFLMSLAQEQDNFNYGLYIMIFTGFLMIVVACIGSYGAIRESQCMLVTFFSCLLVVIVAQIAAGAWLYSNSNRLEELVKSSVINTVKNKYGVDNSYTETVNAFQSDLGCCGAIGPADWIGSKYATKDPSIPVSLTVSGDANNVYKVPESCCKDKDSDACKVARNIKVASAVSPAIYSEGCIDKLMDALISQKNILIGVFAAIGILELLGLILSLVLSCPLGSCDSYKA